MYYLILKVNLCPSIHERLDRSGMPILGGDVKGGPTILHHIAKCIYLYQMISNKYKKNNNIYLFERHLINGKANSISNWVEMLKDQLHISSVL